MTISTKIISKSKKKPISSRIVTHSNKKILNRYRMTTLVISTVFISSAIILATMISDSFAQGANNNKNNLDCKSIASTIGGMIVPNPNKICDVLIPRPSPIIIGPGNMNMNKFSTINSIVEVGLVSDLMVKSGPNSGGANTSPKNAFVMGEFALLEPQLVPMVKAAVDSNWTIAAVHNHMIQEKPKMIFVHWSAQGDLNAITSQIKNVLSIVGKVPGGGT